MCCEKKCCVQHSQTKPYIPKKIIYNIKYSLICIKHFMATQMDVITCFSSAILYLKLDGSEIWSEPRFSITCSRPWTTSEKFFP